ncbi:MAG: adenylate/guanylate cyclase domain-containing protein, partial [Pseudomonadota bacterium]
MRCGKCNFDNDQGRAFCASCGSELPVECRICGFGNEHAAKYCGGCGASIEQHWRPRVLDAPEIGSMSHETHSTSTAPLGLERRQLTVMFCDIVNSTGLAERVQPETLIKIFAAYRDLCAYAIEELGGTIANFMGDGVLIYFGYPKAQDDSVVQAVRGGRRIIERLKALNLRLELEYGEAIQLRIGIHTGLVIAGDFQGEQTRQGLAVFGNTPNIAARLQTLCEPNQVVVSETTHHLIEGLFRCELLGTRALKGVASPMAIYRVVEPTGVATRLEAAAARGLSPLIGRENELKMLLGAWSLAKQGKRQLVLVEGEPGIGKSRLIRALYDLVATEAHTRNHYACAPYYQNSALRPAINQFELALHIGDGDPNDLRLDKLERFLTELELPVDEIAPLFAALMGMVPGDRYPRLELDPKTRKTKTLEAAVAVAEASQRRQPMLLVVEDAHWIDPSTVELLTLVLDRLAEARLLMVVTYRPEFSPPWPDTDAVIRIVLNRLQDDEGKGLIVSMAEEQSLSPALVDAIRKRAEGIPLFLEELTRAVLESGLDDPGEALIPASLQDLLTARLDRLSTLGRDLVQTASVLGRVFPLDLLVRATSRATIDLEALMAELESANVVYRKATGKDVRYEFRHALIQEAAYGQMLRERRQDQHARIGEVLEAHFPDVANETPEIIAGHYTEAGAVAKAVPLWQQAGDRAARQSANLEAIAHYQKGLSLCAIMGDAKACDRSELALQYRLAGPLIATKGYTSPGTTRKRVRLPKPSHSGSKPATARP